MSPLAAAILITWNRNAAYVGRLVGDLDDCAFVAVPPGLAPGIILNHPAWTLLHLALYARVAGAIARGAPFPDPIDDPHGMKSSPVAGAGAYPAREEIIVRFTAAHDDAGLALLHAPDATFALPNPLERQRAAHPTVGDMLVMLMVKHESMHLGQLSAWRRAMGLARVAM